jgi:hypothetical protein
MFVDKEAKTVKIPVRMVNGQVKYFYGGNLPKVEDGVIGELILPEYSILDDSFVSVSNCEQKIEVLPSGISIMVAVNMRVPTKKKNCLENIRTQPLTTDTFVRVELKDPLHLLLRGTKKSKLMGARCSIPCLETDAGSLNNAYTIISEEFEPERISHTGNVFNKCYYEGNSDIWFPLEALREAEEGKFEEMLFLDDKFFKLIAYPYPSSLSADENLLLASFNCDNQISGKRIKEIFKHDKFKYLTVIHSLVDKAVIE